MNTHWWQLEFTFADPDQILSVLFERNLIQGSESKDATRTCVYVRGTPAELHTVQTLLTAAGATVSTPEEIKEQNWVQQCPELWTPIEFGEFRLLPVSEEQSDTAEYINPILGAVMPSGNEIFICPGMGFGTGHHESTQLSLHMLLELTRKNVRVKNVLDFGCGNGVLALATVKLLSTPQSSLTVYAIDNDELAIDNARTNLRLNPTLAAPITLAHETIKKGSCAYDLVLANIYSEILRQYEEEIYSNLAPGGYAILAGLTVENELEIQEAFPGSRWDIVERKILNGWLALLYRRIK